MKSVKSLPEEAPKNPPHYCNIYGGYTYNCRARAHTKPNTIQRGDTLTLQARRCHYQGNTYHAVHIHIERQGAPSRTYFSTDFEYGYDLQYRVTAQRILTEAGELPEPQRYKSGGREPIWRQLEDIGASFNESFIDVASLDMLDVSINGWEIHV